ncbi:MAG TPA: extracellular solute-binding protein, partial [Dehalococcoidia bacterium]|nr:extracellular solute-binding protein [Dehalococcoidia bacterium]
KPLGALDPIEPALILPEVKEGKNWLGGTLEFADREHLSLVMVSYSNSNTYVNSGLAKPEEFKSYKDLLDPKWKGKILLHDPRISGPGAAVFAFFYQHKELGPDFVRALARQDLKILRDTGQELEWLGQGKYPICIACSTETAATMVKQGVPIATINPAQLKEGGYLSAGAGAVAMLNKAPHPNAAKVYVNWLLTQETQTALARAAKYASRRLDVPNQEWLEPWQLPNANFWPAYDEPAIALKGRLDPFLKEVFGE